MNPFPVTAAASAVSLCSCIWPVTRSAYSGIQPVMNTISIGYTVVSRPIIAAMHPIIIIKGNKNFMKDPLFLIFSFKRNPAIFGQQTDKQHILALIHLNVYGHLVQTHFLSVQFQAPQLSSGHWVQHPFGVDFGFAFGDEVGLQQGMHSQ